MMFLNLLSRLLDQYAELVAATHFLSILPLPGPRRRFETEGVEYETETPRLTLGSAYFPLVGVLLGLVLYILLLLLSPLLPQIALAALLVVALVILTGGLHLDGLMDSCDGLFGGRTRDRRLEIMRDSRVGSFGVLGGGCALLLKFAFFASLNTHALSVALFVILPCARWAMVLALRMFPSARSTGLGVTFRQTVTLQRLLAAGSIALLAALVVGHVAGILAWIAASFTTLLLGIWITRSIGGLTGDTYGAIEEMTEFILLFLLVCTRSWI